MNISVDNQDKLFTFCLCVLYYHIEGTVSQIFDLGPTFYFMKSKFLKNDQKLPVFCHKIKTRT